MEFTSNKKKLFFTVAWLVVCASLFSFLGWYKSRPGPVGKINYYWPQNISQQLVPNQYTLVMFAHPQCGCTSASLSELEKLLASSSKKLSAKIFFYHPKGTNSSWAKSSSRDFALKLPQTEVFFDEGGETARRFGAMTSGQVMVYLPTGELAFAGGITESRGHIGESAGGRAIASTIKKGTISEKFYHTFGCQLFSESEIKQYRK